MTTMILAEQDLSSSRICGRCGGAGRINQKVLPGGVLIFDKCPDCKGRGTVDPTPKGGGEPTR